MGLVAFSVSNNLRSRRRRHDAAASLLCILETVMAADSNKSDQIRKLREDRIRAAEKVAAESEIDTKRDQKSAALKSEPKIDI